MAGLPYVTSPGNVDKALNGIKAAATPPTAGQDFVKTILKIPGGSGNQMTSFLKKIGFVASDGKPTDIYRKFRNDATSGQAVVDAIKIGYAPLYLRNEYAHALDDEQLKGLVIEETGQKQDASTVALVVACFNALKKHAKWAKTDGDDTVRSRKMKGKDQDIDGTTKTGEEKPLSMGMNLSYTINLNLPATSDVSVFNAIFKSLKENLLKVKDE